MAKVTNKGTSPYGFYDTGCVCHVLQPGESIYADVPAGVAELCRRDDFHLSIEDDNPEQAEQSDLEQAEQSTQRQSSKRRG